MFKEDLGQFLRDFGVEASFAGKTVLVLYDCPDAIVGEFAQSTEYKITYPANVFCNLVEGAMLSVNGKAFEVNSPPALIEDGAFKEAYLTAL